MEQFEKQNDRNRNKLQENINSSSKDRLLVEVASDDRRVQLDVDGNETVGQVKCKALGEMQLPAKNPERYIVIGANRQPVDDKLTVNKILAGGQTLDFRLIPQVVFGWKKLFIPFLRIVRCLIRS
jgi:hypothetical protein